MFIGHFVPLVLSVMLSSSCCFSCLSPHAILCGWLGLKRQLTHFSCRSCCRCYCQCYCRFHSSFLLLLLFLSALRLPLSIYSLASFLLLLLFFHICKVVLYQKSLPGGGDRMGCGGPMTCIVFQVQFENGILVFVLLAVCCFLFFFVFVCSCFFTPGWKISKAPPLVNRRVRCQLSGLCTCILRLQRNVLTVTVKPGLVWPVVRCWWRRALTVQDCKSLWLKLCKCAMDHSLGPRTLKHTHTHTHTHTHSTLVFVCVCVSGRTFKPWCKPLWLTGLKAPTN